jgi:predicted component of type VI protein secretion system
VFEVRGGVMTVMDCGSTNGTSVDGATLVANQPAALRGGEKLVTGNYAFAFHMPATFIAYLKRVVQL